MRKRDGSTAARRPLDLTFWSGLALFALSGLLLVSMGGAVVLAPVSIPLLFMTVRKRPSRPFRAVGAGLAGLTCAELAWALTYVSIGEAMPWIWLLPAMTGLLVGLAFARTLVSDGSRSGLIVTSQQPG